MSDLISRQAVIEAFDKESWSNIDIPICKEIRSAVKKTIEQLPSAEPDRGYIEQIKWERDVAIQQLADLGCSLGEKPRTNGDTVSREAAVYIASGYCHHANIADELRKLPSAEPERKTGKWEQDNPFTKPRCSECGEPCFGLHGFDYTLTPYCPNCGTKMEVEHG